MALLDVIDNANLTRLQRFVQATTLVPGDDASISARQVNNLARAVKLFAEAQAPKIAAEQMEALVAAYAGTPWHEEIEKRAKVITSRWRMQKAIS